MKSKRTFFLLMVLLCVTWASAQIPLTMNYQGVLRDGSGNLVADGDYSLAFNIYNVSSGGSSLWTETHSVVPVSNGVFSVVLGNTTPLSLPFDIQYYLGITVAADPELSPRTVLTSSPYSVRSLGVSGSNNVFPPSGNVGIGTVNPGAVLNTVGPDGSDLLLLERSGVTGGGLRFQYQGGGHTISSLDAGGIQLDALGFNPIKFFTDGSERMRIAPGGNVGIGTTTPVWPFEVSYNPPTNNINPVALFRTSGATTSAGAIRFQNTNNNGWNIGITTGDAFAINYNLNISQASDLLRITPAGNVGIGTTSPGAKLDAQNLLGGSTGISGQNTFSGQSDGRGVYGRAVNADGFGYGGFFEGGWYGVLGSALAGAYTGSGTGVYGSASGTAGIRYGVFGTASGSGGTKYGVYGTASGGTTNYAGYFSGDVFVSGFMSKGGGSFKIDHPLDPQNKYLVHSFVESPDMMNVYNGNVTLDAYGEAMVTLPAYFESLNKDFRYQLTAIGGPGPNLYISQKIQSNSFRISGGQPGAEVSWQVTGIRKDAWAEQNRIQVEVDKPADEKGLYLHPEVYGQSKESAIPAVRGIEAEVKIQK